MDLRIEVRSSICFSATIANRQCKISLFSSGDNKVSVMHLNSDHMADPEVVFWTGSSAGWISIEVTQLIGGRRVYEQSNETGTAIMPISHRRQASLSEFADTWADNITDQG